MTKLLNYSLLGPELGAAPVLVIIHGLFGSLENLGPIARVLAESHSVVSVDLPNHGRSPQVAALDMSLTAMAQQLDQTLQALNLEQASINQVSLLGHSLGGKVAMEYALIFPAKVKKLIVADIAPVQYQPRHQAVFAGLKSVNLTSITSRKEAERSMADHIEEEGVRLFLLKSLERNPDPPGFRWRMNIGILEQAYPSFIAAPRMAQFDGPVLFIKGADSDYLLAEHQPEVQARFSQAAVKIIHGTGHWLHSQKPVVFSKLASKFLII